MYVLLSEVSFQNQELQESSYIQEHTIFIGDFYEFCVIWVCKNFISNSLGILNG